MKEQWERYGTDESDSLGIIREHGFKPIAITTMICEETFVFETCEEALEAANKLEFTENKIPLVCGFWYGRESFEKEHAQYLKQFNGGDAKEARRVSWL